MYSESAGIQRLWRSIATMTHTNQLLEWLAYTIVYQFGIPVAQLWRYQLQSDQQCKVELLALASADASLTASILASPPITALVESMTGPRSKIALQPLHHLLPNHIAILLSRRGLAYCTGYCVEKDLYLPSSQYNYQPTEHSFSHSKLIVLLFFGKDLQGSLEEARSFLEMALELAVKRGLLRTQHVVQRNEDTTQHSPAISMENFIPRRTADVASNPLTFSIVITDKNARTVYDAIDDHRTVRELANITRLTVSDTVKALQVLLKQQRIQLYEPGKYRK